jgi:HEAT repeat protein/pectate lyase
MLRTLASVAVVLVLSKVAPGAAKAIPAFPGAEGFGAAAVGGRGGKVLHVTNLKPSGPGSLAAALAASGPRTVVFDVSGVIPGDVRIRSDRVTIAGQTAPGAGITVHGRLFCRGKDFRDIILRFLRFRPRRSTAHSSSGDCIQVTGTTRLILDHVSVSWGTDENMGLSSCGDLTVQWCAIEESEIVWEGSTGQGLLHNYGMILGYTDRPASVHHCLFAHHYRRAPLVGLETFDYRNNVIYNMMGALVWHPVRFNRKRKGKPFATNVVGNYYQHGPGTRHFPGGAMGLKYNKPGLRCALPTMGRRKAQMYSDGNYFSYKGGYVDLWRDGRYRENRMAEPWPAPAVTTHTAEEARDLVLAHAGCLPRDAVSRRTTTEVRTGTGSWGRDDPEGGLLECLKPAEAPPDGDRDGMPDAWEQIHKLDPKDPADANRIVPKGASPNDRHRDYTWIEFYINECADRLIADAVAEARRLEGEPIEPPPPPRPPKPAPPSKRRVDVAKELGRLASDNAKTRRHAAAALGSAGPAAARAVPALVRALADRDKYVRRSAGGALASIGKPAVPALLDALGHDDASVRAGAARSLGAIGTESEAATQALLKVLREDENDGVRGEAMTALSRMSLTDATFVTAFIRAGSDSNVVVRRMATEALGRAGEHAAHAVPVLVKLLHDANDVNCQFGAAWALSQVGPTAKAAVPDLVAALGSVDGRVYGQAAETLRGLGENAVPGLRNGLASSDPHVRLQAALTLRRIGPPARPACPDLVRCAADKNPAVRLGAARALGRIGTGSADAVTALTRRLTDDAWQVRWAAAKSLGELGPEAAGAANALKRAAGDSRREVAAATAWALTRIRKD